MDARIEEHSLRRHAMLDMYLSGMTRTEISLHFGSSVNAVRKAMSVAAAERGVSIKRPKAEPKPAPGRTAPPVIVADPMAAVMAVASLERKLLTPSGRTASRAIRVGRNPFIAALHAARNLGWLDFHEGVDHTLEAGTYRVTDAGWAVAGGKPLWMQVSS